MAPGKDRLKTGHQSAGQQEPLLIDPSLCGTSIMPKHQHLMVPTLIVMRNRRTVERRPSSIIWRSRILELKPLQQLRNKRVRKCILR